MEAHQNYTHIQNILEKYPVVLFMKGTPDYPACGFSHTVVAALKLLGTQFHSVDILEDPELRQNLKTFSQWPTFPQLYVKGQLIGGCDIVREMMDSHELETILAPYTATATL